MQKAEAQHTPAQSQPAQRQGGTAVLASPQGEQIAQLEEMVEASPQAGKLAQLAAMVDNSPSMALQRKAINAIHNSPNMTFQRQRFDSLAAQATQRQEAEEPLQAKVAQREEVPAKPNNTGLPDNLKSGIESLSGMSMDNVKVHYNSSQPAQLNALAYAQGTDIHVAPGQEQHLSHEAWHVVQQAQGRVKPTMQMKDGVPVNDDAGLEREADVMGEKAVQMQGCMYGERHDVHIRGFVQRKKVAPGGLAGDGTAKVWLGNGEVDTGHVFKKGVGEKDSKEELIKEIAEKAGAIGNNFPDANWLDDKDKYNQSTEAKTDPFRLRVSGEYGESSESLTMDYHMGKKWSGYVVRVDDNGQAADMQEQGLAGGGKGAVDVFSNIHHKTGDQNILGITDVDQTDSETTKEASEQGFDAYTKLAGEGARFLAVRNITGTLTDNTLFFERKRNKVPSVSFAVLWGKWKSNFGKKYNIKDDEIAAELDDIGSEKELGDITTDADYNLGEGRLASEEDIIPLVRYTVYNYEPCEAPVMTQLKKKIAELDFDEVTDDTGQQRKPNFTIVVYKNIMDEKQEELETELSKIVDEGSWSVREHSNQDDI